MAISGILQLIKDYYLKTSQGFRQKRKKKRSFVKKSKIWAKKKERFLGGFGEPNLSLAQPMSYVAKPHGRR